MKKYNLIGLKLCVLNLLKLLPTVFNKRILLSKVKSQSFFFLINSNLHKIKMEQNIRGHLPYKQLPDKGEDCPKGKNKTP